MAIEVTFVEENDKGAIFRVVTPECDTEICVNIIDEYCISIGEAYVGVSVINYLRMISGLIGKDSNFIDEVEKLFQMRTQITEVVVSVNGTEIAMSKGDSYNDAFETWKLIRQDEFKKIVEESRR